MINQYSWNILVEIAEKDPARLVELLNNDELEVHELTFAAEVAGLKLEPELVFDSLFRLLGHESPIVREGALLGIEAQDHVTDPLLAKLKDMMINDPSEGVRTTAQEVYENI